MGKRFLSSTHHELLVPLLFGLAATACGRHDSTRTRDDAKLPSCDPGEFSDGDGCLPCVAGTFSLAEASSCTAHTECLAGEYRESMGDSVSDTTCTPCAEGTWDHDDDVATLCLPHQPCPAGWLIAEAGTTTQDNVCSPCQVGEYSEEQDAESCTSWTTCAVGDYVSQPPSFFSDRICTTCKNGYSEVEDSPACIPWLECGEGRVEDVPGTTTTDRTCRPWQWLTQFGSDNSDYVNDMAVDSAGHIYLAGHTFGTLEGTSGTSAGERDFFIAKFDSSGTPMWTKQFGTAGQDSILGIGVDAFDNIFVGGHTYGAIDGEEDLGGVDLVVARFDSSGEQQWIRQFGTHANDFTRGIFVDGSGNSFLVASTFGTYPGQTRADQFDLLTVALDSSGVEVWASQVGTAGQDLALDISADPAGNIYVAGHTTDAFPDHTNGGDVDGVILKYASDGSWLWTHQIDGPGADYPEGVAATNSAVYVGGRTNGLLGESYFGAQDAFIMKLTVAGAESWVRQAGLPAEDVGNGVTLNGTDEPVLFGRTSSSLPNWPHNDGGQAFLQQYDAEGQVSFTRQIGTPLGAEAASVRAAGSGSLLIAGYTVGEFTGHVSAGNVDGFVAQLLD